MMTVDDDCDEGVRIMGKRVHRRTTIALISAAVAVAVLVLIAVPRIYLASAPVVVTYRHDAGTQNAASSAWAKRVEQLCRCQVTWRDVLSDSKEWTTRVRYGDISSYLSGELGVPVPDILINIDSPERYYARPLNRSARYLDLRQYMDRMPNVSKYFHSEPEAWLVAQGDDGTVRSIPGDAGDDYDGSLSHMLINRVWLDKVGMSTPQTWDELLDVLRAFRDRDPNGNGKHDEIPMLFSPQADIELGNGLKELPSGWPLLLNSTGIATQLGESALGWSGFYVDHGTVKNYAGSDNLKRVGDYLSRLSSEQLISKDSFSGAYKVQQWNEQAKQDMENGHLEGIYDSESDAAVNDHSAAARPALNAVAQVVPASTSDTAKADTRAGYAELLSSDTPVVGVAFVQDASAFAANANQYQSIPIPAEHAGATVT